MCALRAMGRARRKEGARASSGAAHDVNLVDSLYQWHQGSQHGGWVAVLVNILEKVGEARVGASQECS